MEEGEVGEGEVEGRKEGGRGRGERQGRGIAVSEKKVGERWEREVGEGGGEMPSQYNTGYLSFFLSFFISFFLSFFLSFVLYFFLSLSFFLSFSLRCLAGGGGKAGGGRPGPNYNYTACFPLLWSLNPNLLRIAPEWVEWYYNKSYETGVRFEP